jgi:hypothetical protein
VVEAHAEEEQARGVNLDGGRTGDVDFDGGGSRCGIEVDAEEERSTRRQC